LQIGFVRIVHPMAQLGDLLLGPRDFAHMPDNLLPPDGNNLELWYEFELPALRGRKKAYDGGVIVSFPEPEFSCLFARPSPKPSSPRRGGEAARIWDGRCRYRFKATSSPKLQGSVFPLGAHRSLQVQWRSGV
jgi:hypothetical protein